MRTDAIWAGAILLSASLVVSSLVPSVVGYVAVLGIYALFVGTLVATDRFAVVYHWAVVPMVLLIWALFALTTVLDPTVAGVLRLGAFIVITGINLFVVPATIDRAAFHDVLAYTAGAFVLVGLPTVFVGSYGITGFTISPWHTNLNLLGVALNTPTSVFDNPNYLSSFAAIGAIAAGARYVRLHTPVAVGLIGVNVLGVVLAGGRAALLALVAAGGLYAVYWFYGRTVMAGLIALGIFIVIMGFAMAFHLIPGPGIIANVDLSGRRALWTAAYEAMSDRPAIGWGPGKDIAVLAEYMGSSVNATHNSYLRMFLISGVLGGGAYLVLTLSAVIIGIRNARSESAFTLFLLAAFIIIQIFEGFTIFGLSLLSILGALFVGYIQPQQLRRELKFDTYNILKKSTQDTVTQ